MTTRREFTSQVASLALLTAAGFPRLAAAQQPETARLLVGFPPGGGTDIVARRLADKLRGTYASTVIGWPSSIPNCAYAASVACVYAMRR